MKIFQISSFYSRYNFYNSYCFKKFLFFFFLTLFSLDCYSMNWPRYPTDSEISKAIDDYLDSDNAKIRIGVKYFIVKYHSISKSRQGYQTGLHSFALLVIEEEYEQFNQTFKELNTYELDYGKYEISYGVYSNDSRYYFSRPANFFYETPYYLKKYDDISTLHNDVLAVISNNTDLKLGFAPLTKINNQTNTNQNPEIIIDPKSDDDFPWEVVIGGAAIGAAVVAIRKRLKKSKNNKKEDNYKEKEKAGYILQLSTKEFDFSEEKQGNLEVSVVKVTETSEKSISAAIQIINPEPALHIQPSSGTTPLKCKLFLKDQPKENQFKITVIANAEGHQYQKDIKINAGGEPKIVFETAPDNKRSLRPDINRLITLYAQVVDANNKPIDNLTKAMVFKPIGDWAEISDPIWDEGWAAINVGASNPNSVSISSHPPATMEVLMNVEFEDDKEPLQEKLVINLLDCYLESELYHCSFPATEERSKIRFKVWVENAGEEIKWNFKGIYRIGVDIEDDPLTEISFEKESETEVWVTLTGPIMNVPEGSRSITKTLVIGASQEDEEPIESHINVTLSKEGLFLERGFDKEKSINILANKPVEKLVELSLFRLDEKSNQILPDKKGLGNLKFELLNNEKTIKNLVSILQPEITFDQLVSNIPYGRYKFTTAEEIPGAGETYELKYSITAETSGEENPKDFYQEIIVKVQTKDIGKKIKTWEQAYSECKYMIDNYVPHSNAREKLTQILETQKHFLDTEGLVALRNKIGHIAAELVLAEGAEGYKEVDKWATRIETTLEWTQWAGDLCFAALASYYLKGLGATAAGMIKAEMIDAINFFIYEKDTGWEAFKNRQIDKLMPYLMSTTKGRLLNIENIEKLVGKNKALCWAVYVSTQFLFHLYQTKSMIEAAKNTGREVRDELLVQFLGKQLKSRHGEYNQKAVEEKQQKQSEKKQNEVGKKVQKGTEDYERADTPPDTSGYTTNSKKMLQNVAQKFGVKIFTRPTNIHAKKLLESGKAIPKKSFVKNKTINEFDTYIGASENDIGKVGSFKPKLSRKLSKLPKAIQEKVIKRYKQRKAEYIDQAHHLEQNMDKLYVKKGVVYDKLTGKPYTGDIDIFDIRGSNGEKLPKSKIDQVIKELRKSHLDSSVEHGAHVEWDWKSIKDPQERRIAKEIYDKIMGSHTKGGEALVEFSPDAVPNSKPKSAYYKGKKDVILL